MLLCHPLIDLRRTLSAMGDGGIFQFTIICFATFTPFCILRAWVYSNTSSLLAVPTYASYTGTLMVFFPTATFWQGVLWQVVFVMALRCAAIIPSQSPARRSPFSACGQPNAPMFGGGV